MRPNGWLNLHLAFRLRPHVILFERTCTWTFLVNGDDAYLHHQHPSLFIYQCFGSYVCTCVNVSRMHYVMVATRLLSTSIVSWWSWIALGYVVLGFPLRCVANVAIYTILKYDWLLSVSDIDGRACWKIFCLVLNGEPGHNFIHLSFFLIQSLTHFTSPWATPSSSPPNLLARAILVCIMIWMPLGIYTRSSIINNLPLFK